MFYYDRALYNQLVTARITIIKLGYNSGLTVEWRVVREVRREEADLGMGRGGGCCGRGYVVTAPERGRRVHGHREAAHVRGGRPQGCAVAAGGAGHPVVLDVDEGGDLVVGAGAAAPGGSGRRAPAAEVRRTEVLGPGRGRRPVPLGCCVRLGGLGFVVGEEGRHGEAQPGAGGQLGLRAAGTARGGRRQRRRHPEHGHRPAGVFELTVYVAHWSNSRTTVLCFSLRRRATKKIKLYWETERGCSDFGSSSTCRLS